MVAIFFKQLLNLFLVLTEKNRTAIKIVSSTLLLRVLIAFSTSILTKIQACLH